MGIFIATALSPPPLSLNPFFSQHAPFYTLMALVWFGGPLRSFTVASVSMDRSLFSRTWAKQQWLKNDTPPPSIFASERSVILLPPNLKQYCTSFGVCDYNALPVSRSPGGFLSTLPGAGVLSNTSYSSNHFIKTQRISGVPAPGSVTGAQEQENSLRSSNARGKLHGSAPGLCRSLPAEAASSSQSAHERNGACSFASSTIVNFLPC